MKVRLNNRKDATYTTRGLLSIKGSLGEGNI
jgi:hypothetical protein